MKLDLVIILIAIGRAVLCSVRGPERVLRIALVKTIVYRGKNEKGDESSNQNGRPAGRHFYCVRPPRAKRKRNVEVEQSSQSTKE